MEKLKFLSEEQVKNIAEEFGTPVFVYDEATLVQAAKDATSFPNAFGLTARYAMKANPNKNILKIFDREGMHIDASSTFEVERAMSAGIAAEKILLSSQERSKNIKELIDKGVHYNATSLQQLKDAGKQAPGCNVGLRVNPGLGSGGTNRTNVGGPGSSFGIWHESIGQAKELVAEYNLKVVRIHTHIGSGSDPAIWQKVASMSIDVVREFPDVHTLDLGGGYKVARMNDEVGTDFTEIGTPVVEIFKRFAEETGREIKLEIEPGTYMVANAGCLIAGINDIVHTGENGYTFLKLDAGMTEVLRPSLYGAQHPIVVVAREGQTSGDTIEAIVTGHCCESGDIFTPASGDPEALAPRELAKAEIGDYLVVEGSGAYCSGMTAKNYNSFPEVAEVLVTADGTAKLARKRQELEQIFENEVEAL